MKKVKIKIVGRTFDYFGDEVITVKQGDKIEWELKNPCPWGIIIKSPVSPLDWSYKMKPKKVKITAKVRSDAPGGVYPYAVSAYINHKLVCDDPEIIIRPPNGNY